MEQFLFKSQNFSGCEEKGGEVEEQAVFEQEGEQWETDQSEECLSREFPIASQRKLLFDIHTGSRKKGQRKMWGLNGQQTNSGVSGVTLLNCEMK